MGIDFLGAFEGPDAEEAAAALVGVATSIYLDALQTGFASMLLHYYPDVPHEAAADYARRAASTLMEDPAHRFEVEASVRTRLTGAPVPTEPRWLGPPPEVQD